MTERWTTGKLTDGTVTNLTEFGAFVEIEPGVEGLIHIGDLSWTRIKHPKEVLKKGQKVEVSIIEVDTDRKRISLGYKQLNDPWKDAAEKYLKDMEVPVKVVRLADFGAFVELEEGVEGLIHISQLSTQRVENPKEVLQEGQEVTARVLEVNPTERRIRLSLRPAHEEHAKRAPREEGAPAASAPREQREPREQRQPQQNQGDRREERPRRRRPDGDRRGRETSNSQLPQEEMNFSIGDLLKHQEKEEAE